MTHPSSQLPSLISSSQSSQESSQESSSSCPSSQSSSSSSCSSSHQTNLQNNQKQPQSTQNVLASICACFMSHVWPSPSPQESLSFPQFVLQLIAITRSPAETVFVALRLLFLLRQKFPGSVDNARGSEYRLFVTALVLAHKLLDDSRASIRAWSRITSIPAHEISKMEIEFLVALDYKIHISKDEYSRWCSQLSQFLAVARRDMARPQPTKQSPISPTLSPTMSPTISPSIPPSMPDEKINSSHLRAKSTQPKQKYHPYSRPSKRPNRDAPKTLATPIPSPNVHMPL